MSITTDRRVRQFKRDSRTAATRLFRRVNRSPAAPLTQVESDVDSARRETRARWLTYARRVAVTTWAVVVVYRTVTEGLAFNRELVLLYIATGLITASIGRGRKVFAVVCDWLPFALFLLLYDLSRGATALVGAPTLWKFQPDADRWLFFGTIPTVWLQERIKMPQPPWWEVIISSIYMSFFILPYVVAGVLWLRNRRDWAAFVRRFVALSFAALIVYVVLPAAPPWAAARCTPADIVGGPSNPRCMFRSPAGVRDGGLLGPMHKSRPGAHHFVERISTRGYGTLHLQSAGALVNSQQFSVNLVAAIPSLHAALTAMISVFLWRRVKARWRPLLVAYPLAMAFVLVYSAEHFVIDILLGWAFAAIVLLVIGRLESAWARHRASKSALADSTEPPGDLGGGLAVEDSVDTVGDVADMRRGHHGVQRAQRMPRWQRLSAEDIEAGPGESMRPQGVDESRLVDDWAAGCVD